MEQQLGRRMGEGRPLHVLMALRNLMYLRHYASTIGELVRRGHRVTLVCDSEHKKITEDIRQAALDLQEELGVELLPAPEGQGFWAQLVREIRAFRDYSRYFDPRLSSSQKCAARAESFVYPPLRRPLGRPEAGELADVKRWRRARFWSQLAYLVDRCLPPSAQIVSLLRQYKPDVVVVSPLVDFNSNQTDLVKAARLHGIPSVHAVASWDNLTNKGLVHVCPDRVLVWNEAQKEEAVSLHNIPADRIVLTGAQLFDHWFERKPSRDRASFCAAAGLDPDRPYILYTCSSVFIARHESDFVLRWLQHLRSSDSERARGVGGADPPTSWKHEICRSVARARDNRASGCCSVPEGWRISCRGTGASRSVQFDLSC